MYPRDWALFLQHGQGKEIACAQLMSPEIVDHLGAASDTLYIGHECAMKAVGKHGLSPEHFALIFDTVEFGMALDDRPRHVTFLHQTALGWFQVTIKRAEVSRRLYVATFYKTNLKEVTRKRGRYPVIRHEKRAV